MISKKVISFFTFGIFLVIAGALLKISKNPQASLILAVGLAFELLAGLLFIWNKIQKK
ncbi:MAG: gliding motility protein GldL [Flavobacteriaceae bacterium]|nr:gliding motility protein GldL [Flavobacteriaceae bacterium]